MHRVIINKLGPIDHCELQCERFMFFTGAESSGKSTIAKVIYFFRTIKDDIITLAKDQAVAKYTSVSTVDETVTPNWSPDIFSRTALKKGLENFLRDKFLRTFGSSYSMPEDMYIKYYFTDLCYITIKLKKDSLYQKPNYVWFVFSEQLQNFLTDRETLLHATPIGVSEVEVKVLKSKLKLLFDDAFSVVYIPAGRSLITLLSQQWYNLYSFMGDAGKRALDSCTKDYLERILKLRVEFTDGLVGLLSLYGRFSRKPTIQKALDLINKILKGSYRCTVNGDEQIVLDSGRYVKINFASSGQQESVWILNLLFYYLVKGEPTLFIIEEPESHLFPESQKFMTELITLVGNCGNSITLTTHSPYVLGALNNLLYAQQISKNCESVATVITKELWLAFDNCGAWFVKNGSIEDCLDREIYMIQNERIDEVSQVINDEFERLLNLT